VCGVCITWSCTCARNCGHSISCLDALACKDPEIVHSRTPHLSNVKFPATRITHSVGFDTLFMRWPTCLWPGGKPDGDPKINAYYRYGGLWKNHHAQISGKKKVPKTSPATASDARPSRADDGGSSSDEDEATEALLKAQGIWANGLLLCDIQLVRPLVSMFHRPVTKTRLNAKRCIERPQGCAKMSIDTR